jgi:hypothetical protein
MNKAAAVAYFEQQRIKRAKIICCADYGDATGAMELALVSGRPTRRNKP